MDFRGSNARESRHEKDAAGMLQRSVFEISQSIVLRRHDGAILLLELGGKWELPGGHLDGSERWEDGLRREVFEETGIKDFDIVKTLSVSLQSSHSEG